MNCEFAEKVSLLIDGELEPAEAGQMRKHVNDCLICLQMQQDFLGLRHQIKSYKLEAEPTAHRRPLRNVLDATRVPLWRRSVTLPAPVFALVIVVLLALGTWSLFMRGQAPNAQVQVKISAPASEAEQGGLDFSHYDRGERAVIYKIRRLQSGAVDER